MTRPNSGGVRLMVMDLSSVCSEVWTDSRICWDTLRAGLGASGMTAEVTVSVAVGCSVSMAGFGQRAGPLLRGSRLCRETSPACPAPKSMQWSRESFE